MISNKNINVTLSMPKYIVDDLKEHTSNLSKYVSEAIMEKRAREKRAKALHAILSGPPTFTDIDDSSEYIHYLRAIDKERDKRLGLI